MALFPVHSGEKRRPYSTLFEVVHTAPSQLTAEETLQWLALRMVPGLGTVTAIRLLKRLGSPQAIFRSSASELEGAELSPSQARNIVVGSSFDDAVQQQERMMAVGARLVTIQDPVYPKHLREIFDPPLLLFALGRLELLATHSIAVVGTRSPSPYGIAAAERLTTDLAQAGLTIISGMARGVDTVAHKSALEAKGNTIAVFGCGVDVLYPSSNRKLYDQIADRGLLISEFPMEAPAFPQNFPIRNRIVSGLSVGVVVIEGAQYSGSGITARLAADQGREVFAVPGNITSKMSWGPNLLIKQGAAKLVQEWSDITNELSPEIRRYLLDRAQRQLLASGLPPSTAASSQPEAPLEILARKLLNSIQVDTPQQFDRILESFPENSSSELIAALFDLEMSGLIRQLPGKNFVKVW